MKGQQNIIELVTRPEMKAGGGGHDNETGLQTKNSFASTTGNNKSRGRWSPGSNGDEPNCLAGEINDHNKGETSVRCVHSEGSQSYCLGKQTIDNTYLMVDNELK